MKSTRVLRPLLISFVAVAYLFMSVAKPVQAASTTSDYIKTLFNIKESSKSFSTAIISENVSQQDHGASSISIIENTVLSSILGGEGMAKVGGLNAAQSSILEKAIGHGVIGDINQGIVALYTPPASARTYVADLMKSARIIPEAQAQGLGFSALDPILETWKTFRNLAYLFFVVLFLVIGFMIMLRTKVGQAAITAQQAIPSVIIAMLAVTFSYAIAGFMIDLMYVVMYMLAGFFTEGPQVITHNMLGLVGLMFQGTDGVQETIEQFMEDALNIGWLGDALAWLSSLLGSVIVGVAVLFAAFKVFFELIKAYVAVLIQIVFSPIILMFGAIPGKNVFGKWIKDLAGNLILWPVVLLCILVQRMLTAPIRSLQGTGNTLDAAFGGGFMPPFLVGQGQASIIPVIIGLGVLLVIPEIMQQVKKAMGVSEGVFGELAKAAGAQIKEGVPLGGRLGAGSMGGILGTAGQLAANVPRALQGSPENIGKRLVHGLPEAFGKGASTGFSATQRVATSIGAGQPDIVNLVTNPLDDIFLSEELKEERRLLQSTEDINQRIASHRPNMSIIPKKWTESVKSKINPEK